MRDKLNYMLKESQAKLPELVDHVRIQAECIIHHLNDGEYGEIDDEIYFLGKWYRDLMIEVGQGETLSELLED